MGGKVSHLYTVEVWDERFVGLLEVSMATDSFDRALRWYERQAATLDLPVTLRCGARVVRRTHEEGEPGPPRVMPRRIVPR
jgi:catechol 2,3-dioxygenase-like lactoylglutathione lyase family enzyme